MNVLEIDESVNDIQRALGFKVQSVFLRDKTLVLKLWQNHIGYWLVLSTRFGQQGVFLIEDSGRLKIKNEKKPLSLFATTHLHGSAFVDIVRDESIGRQVELTFASPEADDLKIEICLIPSALNITVSCDGKKVHLNKPKDLPQASAVNLQALKVRALDLLKEPWFDELEGGRKSSQSLGSRVLQSQNETVNNPVQTSSLQTEHKKTSALEVALQKKRKALKKVNQDLLDKSKNDYFEFATLLTTDVQKAQEKFPELYDEKKNKHKLKDYYFEKHKNLAAKRDRVKDRLFELEKEIKDLESFTEDEWISAQSQKSKFKVESKAPVKTRKLELASDLVAYYGKSAADNLKLLRAAKSWHYWFHIKDVPSSHMIVVRDKSRTLTDEEIKKASHWFLTEMNEKAISGAVVEILMAECRFVKPIRGDKMGRVNYSHEHVFRLRL